MTLSSIARRRGIVQCLGVALALLLVVAVASGRRARAQGDPPVVTTISTVESVPLESGGKSMLLYQATHEFSGPVAPGSELPGARVERSSSPAPFAGAHGLADKGDVAAWLAPPAGSFAFQFDPSSKLVENSYFTNRLLEEPDAVPLDAGDRFDITAGDLFHNALLPSDRARGSGIGTLAWDHGQAIQHVEATYGEVRDGLDAVFVRADLVARGGDVDARRNPVESPPLVIDLPRSYPDEVNPTYIATVLFPYTAYIENFTIRVTNDPAKIVLRARARGYLFEANEYELGGGARVEEWHVPIYAVVAFKTGPEPARRASQSGSLPARASLTLPSGGVGVVGSGADVTRLTVPRGGTIRAGEGVAPQIVDEHGEVLTRPTPPDPSPPRLSEGRGAQGIAGDRGVESRDTTLIRESAAAAQIDASLTSPVTLRTGGKRFTVTIDPDYRDEGLLALRAVRRFTESSEYVNVATVPFVVVDGVPIKLDRSRLTDLRVVPLIQRLGLKFTGQNRFDRPLTKNRILGQNSFPFGLTVDAIYDLGEGRRAFLQWFVAGHQLREVPGQPDPAESGALASLVSVRSLSGDPLDAAAVHYLEVPETGPVTYGSEQHSAEFSVPLDLFAATPALTARRHLLEGTIFRSDEQGVVTVVAAPAELTATPSPDPSTSIDGRRVAVYYRAPNGVPAPLSFVRTSLLPGPPAQATPAPIGEICAPIQAVDLPVLDAEPQLDIRKAWWDSDHRNLYATMELASLPTAAPTGMEYVYEFHWRNEHHRLRAGAYLDESGRWSFVMGRGAVTPIEGEVAAGLSAYIRLSIPRALVAHRDGELLRDTSAFSYVKDAVLVPIDRAPDDADDSYGTGGDYVMGEGCSMPDVVPTDVTFTEATDAQHSDPVTLATRLVEEGGTPVAGAEVRFEIVGEASGRTLTATTLDDGVATVTTPATEAPGPYKVLARYAGDESHAPSQASTDLIVSKEDSELDLTIEGRGSGSVLRARLSDLDSPSDGIAARTIDFYSDDELIGSDQTGSDGVATVAVPPGHRGDNRTYEVVFGGDDFYVSSSDDRAGRGVTDMQGRGAPLVWLLSLMAILPLRVGSRSRAADRTGSLRSRL